ncbi:hypothetical protein BDV96DRAFT_557932 [Lophiotrema nucula]|uniref:NB-ARC domain-containing protein n=1 Tax=Lophiotrema nucula TaxID=690887 RepID=A0A6A5YJ52_9PLEO|nr:hypothetical protein BDV96DRAFT_557932 [Lophiotrema nucula]
MEAVGVVAGVVGIASLARWIAAPRQTTGSKIAPKKEDRIKGDSSRGLKVEYSPTTPDIDICFVHGLTGDRRSTWTAKDEAGREVFWPTDLLVESTSPEEKTFPRARILLYGYETNVNSLCWLTERTLYHHANHFVGLLAKARTSCKDRPLLFVVHSLGGLLVRSALIFARVAIKDEREIYLSTFGIVSFATPQTFAGTAPLCDMVDHLCQLEHHVAITTAVHTPEFEDHDKDGWKTDVRVLQRRLDRYKPIAKEIPEVFCYESSKAKDSRPPVSVKRMTLPRREYVHKLCDAVSIEADHVNICKFTTYNREYLKIRSSIRKFFDDFRERRAKLLGNSILTERPHRTIRDLGFFVEPKELQPNAGFVSRKTAESREDYLRVLDEQMASGRLAVLTGPLGYGKSTLAREHAYRQKRDWPHGRYSSIFWLDASSELSLEVSFVRMIRQLRLHYSRGWTEKADQTAHSEVVHALDSIRVTEDDVPLREEDRNFAIHIIMNWLAYPENKGWLLIYDDIERLDAPYAQQFLPPIEGTQRGYILMTSRKDHTKSLEAVGEIPIEPFRRHPSDLSYAGSESILHDSGALLRAEPANKGVLDVLIDGQTDEPDAPTFLGSPLPGGPKSARAVMVERFAQIRVGSFTQDESVDYFESKAKSPPPGTQLARRQTFGQLADELDNVPANIAFVGGQFEATDDPTQKVQAELSSKDDQFEQIPEEFNPWLDTCAMLDSDPLPRLLVEAGFHIGSQTALFGLRKLETTGWVWISEDTDSFKIPDDRRRYRRQQLGASKEGSRSAKLACISMVCAIKFIATDAPTRGRRAHYEQMLLRHVGACMDICKNWGAFVDCEWDVLAELCEKHSFEEKAAIFYRAAGGQQVPNSDTYSQLSNSVFDTAQERADSDDGWDDTTSIGSFEGRGDFPGASKADPLHLGTISRETKTSRTLRSELGLVRMQVKLRHFEQLDQQCQSIFDRIDNKSNKHEERYVMLQLEALRQIILIKIAQTDWASAIQISYDLIERLERKFGPSADDTIKAVHQLAKIHMDQGDYGGAEPLLEQILMTRQQTWGNSNPRTIAVSEDLARAYKAQGRLNNARDAYRRILRIYRELLGEDHIQTGKVKENLSIVYEMMGEFKAADDMHEEALHAAKLLGTEIEAYQTMVEGYEARQQARKGALESQVEG